MALVFLRHRCKTTIDRYSDCTGIGLIFPRLVLIHFHIVDLFSNNFVNKMINVQRRVPTAQRKQRKWATQILSGKTHEILTKHREFGLLKL